MVLGAFGIGAVMIQGGKGNLVQEFILGSHAPVHSTDGGKRVTFEGQVFEQREGLISICIIGHDGKENEYGNGQADLVVVLALDTASGHLSAISIPRDTMVEVQRTYALTDEYLDTVEEQLTLAFSYGSDLQHGAERVCTIVSHLLYNIPLEYYYVFEIDGVGALADVIGGVDVIALENVANTDIKKGYAYHLTGDLANQYVRERDETKDDSSFTRLERQKQFMDEFGAKALDVIEEDPLRLVDIFNGLSEYSLTNLGPTEFAYLVSLIAASPMTGMEMHTLEGTSVVSDETGYVEFYPDADSVMRTVLDIYYRPL